MRTLHGVHVRGFPNAFIVQPTQGAKLISNVSHNLTESGRTIAMTIKDAPDNDDRPPFAFVMIERRATVVEDPHAVLTAATRIALRYVGPDKADEYGRLNGGDGMMAVRITRRTSCRRTTSPTSAASLWERPERTDGEHRPSLQRRQRGPLLTAGELGLQRFPRFPNEPLTHSPILSPSSAPPIPAMQAGTSMRMSASTRSFSFSSSGGSSRSGAGHAEARGARRGLGVRVRAPVARRSPSPM
jgi:hypothetical protein